MPSPFPALEASAGGTPHGLPLAGPLSLWSTAGPTPLLEIMSVPPPIALDRALSGAFLPPMPVIIDNDGADANSRLTAIRVTVLTARLMELWRRGTRDSDTALILVAVVAITAERLTRIDLPREMRRIEDPVPSEMLGTCNISSIAAATGLNRETARRRVNALVRDGVLTRSDRGEIYFPPGFLQRSETRALVRTLLETVTRFVNDQLRDGALKYVRTPAGDGGESSLTAR